MCWLSYTANTMPADVLATLGARASARMVLIPKAAIFPLQRQSSQYIINKSVDHCYLHYIPTSSLFLMGHRKSDQYQSYPCKPLLFIN